jgi:hypothetical protein
MDCGTAADADAADADAAVLIVVPALLVPACVRTGELVLVAGRRKIRWQRGMIPGMVVEVVAVEVLVDVGAAVAAAAAAAVVVVAAAVAAAAAAAAAAVARWWRPTRLKEDLPW